MKNLRWKIQFAKRNVLTCAWDKKFNYVIHYKVVDGLQFVVHQSLIYRKISDFQTDLFTSIRPSLMRNIFTPLPWFTNLAKESN